MDPLGNLQFTTSGALIELVDSTFSLSSHPLCPQQWRKTLTTTSPSPPPLPPPPRSFTFVCWRRAEKVLVHLRDDRKLIGVLRSYDQYGTFPFPFLLLSLFPFLLPSLLPPALSTSRTLARFLMLASLAQPTSS